LIFKRKKVLGGKNETSCSKPNLGTINPKVGMMIKTFAFSLFVIALIAFCTQAQGKPLAVANAGDKSLALMPAQVFQPLSSM
jgi:hypothetical protein